MEDGKKILWIIGIILIAVLLYRYSTSFVIFQPQNQGFLQITGAPCRDAFNCASQYNYLYSSSSTFNVESSVFKINTETATDCGYSFCGGCSPNSPDNPGCYCIYRTCCGKVKVYKDDILIDTMIKGYNCGGYPGCIDINTESSSGTYYASDTTNAGIMVNALSSSAWNPSSQTCSALMTDIVLSFPINSFEVDIPQTKVRYDVGEPITLEIKVINNIGSTIGKLILDYEVPTIIGTMTKQETQEVILNTGLNVFNINIISDRQTELMKVTPKVELNYLTTNMEGVNYGTRDVRTNPSISLGTLIGNTTQIMIIPEGKEGYYRFKNNTCTPIIILPSQRNITTDYLNVISCTSKIKPKNTTIYNATEYIYQNQTIEIEPTATEKYGIGILIASASVAFVILFLLFTRRKK